MRRVEEFEELRPLLFSIAYRMLSSVSEAEDAVQETWLRYEGSATPPASAKAFSMFRRHCSACSTTLSEIVIVV